MAPDRGQEWPDWERHEYISASRIKTFENCPRQFWYEYYSDREPTKPDSKYAKLGTAVHEALEWALDANPDAAGDLRQRVVDKFTSLAGEMELDGPEIGKGKKCITVACKYINQRDDVSIREVESNIFYVLSQYDQQVTAKLDIIAGDEIWDWKTGKSEDLEWVQAAVYKAAFVAEYGYEPECVRFVYLKKGEVNTRDPDRETWQKLARRVEQIHDAVENGEFPANPGSGCFWCPYEFYCEASDVGVGDVAWEAY